MLIVVAAVAYLEGSHYTFDCRSELFEVCGGDRRTVIVSFQESDLMIERLQAVAAQTWSDVLLNILDVSVLCYYLYRYSVHCAFELAHYLLKYSAEA